MGIEMSGGDASSGPGPRCAVKPIDVRATVSPWLRSVLNPATGVIEGRSLPAAARIAVADQAAIVTAAMPEGRCQCARRMWMRLEGQGDCHVSARVKWPDLGYFARTRGASARIFQRPRYFSAAAPVSSADRERR